ncbi:MAG: hypothetical protein KA236_00650 [Verrucomicrobia bacterium]|jgi:hypothetical protein|nr:hypothetical protein [Verrucomicrobiota bacterium]
MSRHLKLDFRRLRPRRPGQRRGEVRSRTAGTSLLGLTLESGRLEGVVLRRANGHLEVKQTLAVSLSLDPLTAAPELAGREIRKHLDAAGVRERRCVVGLPLNWVLTLGVKLPAELPEADEASFLQIEAERGFPYGPESLLTAHSVSRTPAGERLATLVAVPRDQITRLESVLQAAQLRPVSFSLGVTALQPPEAEASHGIVALVPGEYQLAMQITCGGGAVVLRPLEGAFELEGTEARFQADAVARELRITLGQLPPDAHQALRGVRVFGNREAAEEVAEQLGPRLNAFGLPVEQVKTYQPDVLGLQAPDGAAVSAAFSLAARRLAGRDTVFEFLPPRVSAWQQFTAKYSSRRLVAGAMAAGAVAALVLLAFGIQQAQLWYWDKQWRQIKAPVHELEDMQAQIRKYRPWFDDSFRSLSILRRLTEAFPEDGVVAAKTVEIREPAKVTCTGTARDLASLNQTLEKLSAAPEINQVQVEQTRGRTPLQFSFNFQWRTGGAQ